jgi:high-affinity iron transporter
MTAMGAIGKRRSFSLVLLFLPLVLGALLVFFPRRGTTEGSSRELPAFAGSGNTKLGGDKLVFLLQYVGSDYRGAVADGAILDEYEYQEMSQFTRILVEEHARVAPEGSEVGGGLERLAAWVEAKQDPQKVLGLTRELVAAMTRELGLVTYPSRAPSVEEGSKLYASACSQCHGVSGDGMGPSAVGQVPPPTSFRGARMKAVAPHQIYNAVGFGAAGTAMPSYEDAFSPSQRWDVSFYLMTLRDDFSPRAPSTALPVSVRELATLSDDELSAFRGLDSEALDFYRSAVPETAEDELLRLAERKLEESYGAFQSGDRNRAVRLSVEAYLEGIEPTEATLLSLDSRLVRNLERELTQYRALLREGGGREAGFAHLDRIRALTAEARKTLAGTGTGFGFAFVQSASILLREGIEAALLVALLLSYLTAAGLPELRRYTLGGAFAGIVAGALTWLLAQLLVESSTLEREALEGLTSLLAAAVLFSVSFWILHNADLKRWKSYIHDKAKSALGTGSGLALAAVSFLAVYREAFETVLFYQALWLRSGSAAGGAIVLGVAFGLVVLLAVIVLMFRYGKRMPLKPFFAVTGILLGILSLVFAGYGIAELQKIGWVQETPLDWVPYVPFLDLQPTLEGLSLQLGIFLSFLLSWFLAGSDSAKRPLSEARAT